MARFHGQIGFADTVESAPGVWTDGISERNFRGTVPSNVYRNEESDKVNNDASLNTRISIVASKELLSKLRRIRYVRFEGVLWTIDSSEVQRPNLILNLGGVYNGPTGTTPVPATSNT